MEQAGKEGAVREMVDSDKDQYCELFKRVFAEPPWNETWEITGISADLERKMRKKGFIGLAAEYGSAPAGFMTGYKLPFLRAFYLEQLFVDGRYRGAGIGRMLLSSMLSLAEKRGEHSVLLLTKKNSPAEKLYLASGFRRFLPFVSLGGKTMYRKLLP